MKTKELVKQLILADPDGEAEVCVDNVDIIDVDGPMPTYYDGQFVQIVIDTNLARVVDGRGVSKVMPRTSGSKIKLRTMDAEEAFLDNPEAELIQDTYNPDREHQWLETVKKYREAGRELKKEIAKIHEEFKAKENK